MSDLEFLENGRISIDAGGQRSSRPSLGHYTRKEFERYPEVLRDHFAKDTAAQLADLEVLHNIASMNGDHVELVDLALDEGKIDINAVTRYRNVTALMTAFDNFNFKIARRLIERGAVLVPPMPNKLKNDTGETIEDIIRYRGKILSDLVGDHQRRKDIGGMLFFQNLFREYDEKAWNLLNGADEIRATYLEREAAGREPSSTRSVQYLQYDYSGHNGYNRRWEHVEEAISAQEPYKVIALLEQTSLPYGGKPHSAETCLHQIGFSWRWNTVCTKEQWGQIIDLAVEKHGVDINARYQEKTAFELAIEIGCYMHDFAHCLIERGAKLDLAKLKEEYKKADSRMKLLENAESIRAAYLQREAQKSKPGLVLRSKGLAVTA